MAQASKAAKIDGEKNEKSKELFDNKPASIASTLSNPWLWSSIQDAQQ